MRALDQELTAILDAIPYARFLGMRVELAGDEMTAILPFDDRLIGNPILPALHGGVIGAFLEITAVAQLSILQPVAGDAAAAQRGLARQPKPIGVTVEYLRSGRPVDTFARAEVKRAGRRIANVSVEAWQGKRSTPIALLSGRFLLASGGADDGSDPVQPPS